MPYDCYYHIYSKEDVLTCAKRAGINWIFQTGDSQTRVFSAWMAALADTAFGKFVSDNTVLTNRGSTGAVADPRDNATWQSGGWSLRTTWQFYPQLWETWNQNVTRAFEKDALMLDHFNICPKTAEVPVGTTRVVIEFAPTRCTVLL